MKLIPAIKDRLVRWQYARTTRALERAESTHIQDMAERDLLKAFQRMAEEVPAHKQLLCAQGIEPNSVDSIEAFKSLVPFSNKELVFSNHALRELCVDGELDSISTFYSSSGHSKVFSFGVDTWNGKRESALATEYLLDYAFKIFDQKTLLINCLPMGVKIHTRALAVAETSVRADVIQALIKKLSNDFEQFIIVGEHLFLKELIESGVDCGIPWRELRVHLISGGEYISESFRSYLGHLLDFDYAKPQEGMFCINMGLSELATTIFFETPQCIDVRRAMRNSEELREALTGNISCEYPVVMQYFPQQMFVETISGDSGKSELVVTSVRKGCKIPLLRYRTGDHVELLSYAAMTKVLSDTGFESLISPLKLPYVLAYGRTSCVTTNQGHVINPNQVKTALYADFDMARCISGNFRLLQSEQRTSLLVQLKNGVTEPAALRACLADQLKVITGADIAVVPIEYAAFPNGLELSFERKFQYL